MNKIRIYVGHKLTKANPVFLSEMQFLRDHAEKTLADSCEFLKFLGVKNGTAWDVFQQDIQQNVKSCDLFVCITDEESTGLGVEIGAAAWKSGKPMLLVYTSGAIVSRLPLGAVMHYPEQIMERALPSAVSFAEFVKIIQEAITIYALDTDNPVRFPSLDDLARQAGLQIGKPLQKGWKS